jgi:nicotinate-nucleotide adenylyltransferase
LTSASARVGMFGGAFDPPHRAHVELARAAISQLGLDTLHVLPTGDAWHKSRTLTPAEDRLAMTRLAFADVHGARVDDRELRRAGATYSVDTLRELQAENPAAQLHLLMGEDQAASFTRWHAWEEVARLAVLCVAVRGSDAGAGVAALRALPGVRVHALQWSDRPESATEIRSRLTIGQDITELVEPAVARYIASHSLYQPT